MSEPARKPATYQDVLNAPEGMIAQIVDGELYLHPRPALPHARASTILSGDLHPFNRKPGGPRGPGGWQILYEPEIHLGSDILVPDLAGWRLERMPGILKQAFTTMEPDWVCEVLSPSTAKLDRARKMRSYARNQVQYAWLVDPQAETLEIYQLAGAFWQQLAVHAGDEVVRAAPFQEVELELASWWVGTEQPVEEPG